MVQYAEPASTITDGGWSDTSGSKHTSTDCAGSPPTPVDSEYATIDGADVGGGKDFEVKLESITDPGVDTGFHIYIRSRVRNAGGPGEKMDAFLVEGVTRIAVLWSNYGPPDDAFATDDVAVAEVDIANITDFTDLRVQVAVDTLASGEDCDVSMILLEAPDAAASTIDESDSLGLSDDLDLDPTRATSIQDTAGLSDDLEVGPVRPVSSSDTAGLSDDLSLAAARATVQTDTAGLSDDLTFAPHRATSLSDTMGLSDSLTLSTGGATETLELSDTLGLADPGLDTILKTVERDLPASTLGLSDSATFAPSRAHSQSDTIGLSDSLTVQASTPGALDESDTLGLSDALTLAAARATAIQDALGLSDSTTLAPARSTDVADTLGLSDSLALAPDRGISQSDTLGLSDSLTLATTRGTSVTDTLGLSDGLTLQASAPGQLYESDKLGLSDSLALQAIIPVTGGPFPHYLRRRLRGGTIGLGI